MVKATTEATKAAEDFECSSCYATCGLAFLALNGALRGVAPSKVMLRRRDGVHVELDLAAEFSLLF